MRSKNIFVLASLIAMPILLTACRDMGKPSDPTAPDPVEVIGDGMMQTEGQMEDMFFEGTAEVTRYTCPHQGKVDLAIKADASFVMKITTPSVGNKCEPGGDFETAKIYGTVNRVGDEMQFTKCNVSEVAPQGLGNYTMKHAEGGVSCYSPSPDGKADKWFTATFDVKRMIDGKAVE